MNVLRRVRGKTNLGARYVAQSAPDGYTLLFADAPTITVFPVLNPKPPVDIATELVPVGMFARMPIALIAATDHPPETRAGDRRSRAAACPAASITDRPGRDPPRT